MNQENTIHKDLCIIILNYFNDQDTIECVRSVFSSEEIDPPFIVVVDNSDGKSRLFEHLNFYPFLKILIPEKNLGFGMGNNLGIKWAADHLCFKYLMILNNDTLLETLSLARMLSFAENNQSVALFAPCIITSDESPRIWYAGGGMNSCRITPVINFIEVPYSDVILCDSLTEFASGCAMMISSEKIDFSQPLFDPVFFMYDEDVELSLRLVKSGMTMAFISGAIVVHKCQGSQKSNDKKKINQLSPDNINLLFYLKNTIKNRFYILDKHFAGSERFFRKICLSIYWLLKSFQFVCHFRFRAFITVLSGIMYSGHGRIGFNSRKT